MKRHENDGLIYFTFELLDGLPGVVHGITARHGGVSTGCWSSLNLTKGNGDNPEAVEENLRRATAVLGVRREHLVSPNQQHTTRAQRVRQADRGLIIPGADTLHTDEPGVPILLRYADCAPVLLYDPVNSAYAVVHSGWRGTVAGAVPAAIHAMTQAYGSRPEQLVAAIGPSIGPCCYEVGDDVASAVNQAFEHTRDLLPRHGPRRHFDLWSANVRWLKAAGVQRIELAEICTACHNDIFFSYRAGNGHTGHFGALMMMREQDG